MANQGSPAFDPTQLVQQATQAMQDKLLQPYTQAKAMQPMLQAFAQTAQALASDPKAQVENALHLHQTQLALGANILETMLGRSPSPIAAPAKDDRRFAHESWNTAFYDLLKQSYLATSTWLSSVVDNAHGLDPATQAQASFYIRQFIDAVAPTNFFITNPEAMQTAIDTKGQSLIEGFKNVLEDVQRGRISMTDYDKFRVGETIATTKGEVVFRNRLIELIQYTPTTKKVHAKPLLICPPWINRFYILDLQQQNSLVKYLVDQGFQVFLVSWKNPDPSYKNVGFDNYITDGLFAALEATLDISGEKDCNAIGYCIGGTMLSIALAIMEAKKDKRISSATFFTTLTDFSKAGELSLFTDDYQISALEERMEREGVLDGRVMASTFSMLRANDLIWSFVVNNYLLGKQPFPFDILYWNDDSTRMPYAMHSWYLRNLYMENKLAKPNALKVMSTPIDLRTINVPMYMVTGVNDHITPWASCYKPFAGMASESKRFILGKAGHVAGVVCPPTPAGKPVKRSFWAGEASAATGEAWLKTAEEKPDSWWPDYAEWLAPRSGEQVEAPAKAGNAHYKPICAAPGTYVKEK